MRRSSTALSIVSSLAGSNPCSAGDAVCHSCVGQGFALAVGALLVWVGAACAAAACVGGACVGALGIVLGATDGVAVDEPHPANNALIKTIAMTRQSKLLPFIHYTPLLTIATLAALPAHKRLQ